MRNIIRIIVFGVLLSSPALANWTGLNATGGTITFYNSGVCTSVVCTPAAQLSDGTNNVTLTTAGADGASNTLTGVPTYARMQKYNGATWDRWTGAVTVASGGIASGAIASGAMVDLGAQADAAWVSGSGSLIAITKTIAGNTGAPIPAGSAIIGKVGIDQTTPGTTNLVQMPTTTNAGAATVKGGVGVVNGGSTYIAVAASQTATVLQTSTGATGDYLSHCTIYPTSTSPGVVTVFDNTNTAANSAILFPGGATSTSNLVPFAIPAGTVSVNGAWKVTTGANVSVVCVGKFS